MPKQNIGTKKKHHSTNNSRDYVLWLWLVRRIHITKPDP